MSNAKIGGLAAFCIALVVAGAAESITSLIVNRPVRSKKTPLQDRFWKEFNHQVTVIRDALPAITSEELREQVRATLSKNYEAVLIECPDIDHLNNFRELFQLKLDMLNPGSENQA